MGWVFLGVWAAGALGSFRFMFRTIWGDIGGSADWEDVVIVLTVASVMAAVAGPLIFIFLLVRAVVSPHDPAKFARAVGGESSEEKAKRLARERDERERYIDRLERELELK